jgi:hypothetical protein
VARTRKPQHEAPSDDPLTSLRALLDRLPPEEVKAPRVPVARLTAEALALSAAVESAREALLSKRLEEEHLDHLPVLARALAMAQAELDASRGPRRTEAELALEAQAVALRSEMVVAARFALRSDEDALKVIAHVQEGKGLDDLNLDLQTLAVFFDRHARELAKVGAEPAPKAAQARALAAKLGREVARRRGTPDASSEVKEVRDRIASLLIETMAEIRAAGAYAFRKDPRTLAKFHSAYNGAKRKKRRRGPSEAPELAAGAASEGPAALAARSTCVRTCRRRGRKTPGPASRWVGTMVERSRGSSELVRTGPGLVGAYLPRSPDWSGLVGLFSRHCPDGSGDCGEWQRSRSGRVRTAWSRRPRS